MDSLRGRLIVASPSIFDGNFRQSVVLIAEHSEAGAMGVVLSRQSQTTIAQAAPQLEAIIDGEEPIHVGGPVQGSALVVLAEFQDPGDSAFTVLEDIGFVAVGTDIDDLSGAVRNARAFAGHAGWGPGQLEAELEREDWIVMAPRREDIFNEEPEALWGRLLERKGGAYALMARMPFDPSVN